MVQLLCCDGSSRRPPHKCTLPPPPTTHHSDGRLLLKLMRLAAGGVERPERGPQLQRLARKGGLELARQRKGGRLRGGYIVRQPRAHTAGVVARDLLNDEREVSARGRDERHVGAALCEVATPAARARADGGVKPAGGRELGRVRSGPHHGADSPGAVTSEATIAAAPGRRGLEDAGAVPVGALSRRGMKGGGV